MEAYIAPMDVPAVGLDYGPVWTQRMGQAAISRADTGIGKRYLWRTTCSLKMRALQVYGGSAGS
jgi:hypothetical protein